MKTCYETPIFWYSSPTHGMVSVQLRSDSRKFPVPDHLNVDSKRCIFLYLDGYAHEIVFPSNYYPTERVPHILTFNKMSYYVQEETGEISQNHNFYS